MSNFREEFDTLGKTKIPKDAYYGAQTQRAVENFPISGLSLEFDFIYAQAVVKMAAALTNKESGILDSSVADAIVRAAGEIMDGKFRKDFVVDVFQAGAGTSQNMNMNEVLANRAEEILGGEKGSYKRVHPNNHVNMAQSTNDTIPTSTHISVVRRCRKSLIPAMEALTKSLQKKSVKFKDIIKCGRTHLQDAVPMRIGQEIGAWATIVHKAQKRIVDALEELRELCIGGSAVGTGLNTPPEYKSRIIAHINKITGEHFLPARDTFEAMSSMGAILNFSQSLSTLATGLKKIADDIRLLSSGPRTGLKEIILPAVQPGSSIMPGKVNPVMAEMLNMVCFQVIGMSQTVSAAAGAGQLQINVMIPVVAYNILFAIKILSNAINVFTGKCINGLDVNREICKRYADLSPALVTAISPVIGYNKAAEIAKKALEEGKTIRVIAIEEGILDSDELEELLDMGKLSG